MALKSSGFCNTYKKSQIYEKFSDESQIFRIGVEYEKVFVTLLHKFPQNLIKKF